MKSRLSCGDNDAKKKAVELAKLTAAYPQQGQDQVSSDLRIETFFEALEGLPAWAVREARQMIVRGETEYGKPWGPGPTEFGALVKLVMAPMKRDLADIDALLLASPIESPARPEERQRVSGGFEKLKTELEKRA